ncbi:hypothetical protein [Pedobacter arcticus]|uniref:hypothetical protein n=1 Tax=Pedobacter arcticus TaxID=752140 RepID=UPI0012B57CF9|nr:hypothetical protein [Pedobacter arcticus]
MKWTLRFFGFLDLMSFFFMFDQGILQLTSLLTAESFTINEVFSRFLFVLVWVSLPVSAVFLAIPKKAGIIVYYCQIIPRFIFIVFSFGFVSLLSYIIKVPNLENILMPIIIFGEMLRVYRSYQLQGQF